MVTSLSCAQVGVAAQHRPLARADRDGAGHVRSVTAVLAQPFRHVLHNPCQPVIRSGGAGSGAAIPTTRPTTRRCGDKDRPIEPGRRRGAPTAKERTARPTWGTVSGIHG